MLRKRKRSQPSLRERLAASRTPYLYILPAALIMLVITVYPIVFQVFMSFTNYSIQHLLVGQNQAVQLALWDMGKDAPDGMSMAEYRQTDEYLDDYVAYAAKIGVDERAMRPLRNKPLVWEGGSNYGKILQNELALPNYDFWRLFSFNIVWTIINVFFHVVIGVIIALVLDIKGIVIKPIYRALFILPYAIPNFITALVWHNMFDDQFGAINQIAATVNDLLGSQVLPETTRWLMDAQAPLGIDLLPLSFYAALLTNIWLGWPFMMIIATGGLQSISKDLYEAATVDGASQWQQIRNITLPLLRPVMVPAIMLGFIWTFNQFNVIYLVSGGGPFNRTEIMVTQAYKLVREQNLYGVASSFSIVVFFILFVLNTGLNRITRATEAAA